MPSDQLDGSSPTRAWKTLHPLKRINLQPGDSILLKRGGLWANQRLEVHRRGLPETPIVISSFGPKSLTKPHLTDTSSHVIGIGADFIVIDGLKISGARRFGITTLGRNRHNLSIKNSEIFDCTNGISIEHASDVEISRNFIHSIHFRRSNHGAIGITIDNSSKVQISENVIHNCFGVSGNKRDGGAIELFRSNDEITIRKNRASNTWGFIEFGGLRGDTIRNVIVDSNLAVNTRLLTWFNLRTPHDTTNAWGIGYSNITISHNTLIQNAAKIHSPIGASTYLTDSSQIRMIGNTITGDSLFGFIYKGGFQQRNNTFWSPNLNPKNYKPHKTDRFLKPRISDTSKYSLQNLPPLQ